ncbi:pyridoxine/pyridoxamine 5'-phosphate oxidase [Acidocella aquatica]|uniref:Pyridoxine/pyridoxamine 5'-phosphate oxidase n=1 Tax=Acidocella aquatica TaxID=1922313 RepID=A0ABQ6A8A3_9PROT|nr:pyridoxamine 5'-phosphate oxidase [Acidocella aquatica]GLR66359.1 pyridoxine/pyridoxamine 5'-phosphate oxidase [Acidocella aquatica]
MNNDPFTKFGVWMAEAEASEPNDPNAMTLATTSASGRPAARIVLLKGWDERGFVFYSNLESRKADEMRENAQVSLLFHWKSLRRQIRIEGKVSPVSVAEADEYFASRPRVSKLGAWASAQSRPLPSREVFEARLAEVEARFPGEDVPRPENWSGWRLTPDYVEFWEDREFRLHDRQVFTRKGDAWETGLLYP